MFHFFYMQLYWKEREVNQNMNEENKIGYYAIIPSTILLNEKIKANEKLLYAVITVLSNKEGYCYASNAYLGKLLNAQLHTISKWVSHLKSLGFLCLDIIKNDKGEIIQRRIYPNDTPYTINRTYPYSMDRTEGMSPKGQYNNIIDNNINKEKIDRLFNYIINKEKEIPKEFMNVDLNEINVALKRFDMLYPKSILDIMSEENLESVKNITYIIALMVKNKLFHLSNKITRDKLIQVYNDCKYREKQNEGTEKRIENFISYFYKSIENELTKESKEPSFFMPNNDEIEI